MLSTPGEGQCSLEGIGNRQQPPLCVVRQSHPVSSWVLDPCHLSVGGLVKGILNPLFTRESIAARRLTDETVVYPGRGDILMSHPLEEVHPSVSPAEEDVSFLIRNDVQIKTHRPTATEAPINEPSGRVVVEDNLDRCAETFQPQIGTRVEQIGVVGVDGDPTRAVLKCLNRRWR